MVSSEPRGPPHPPVLRSFRDKARWKIKCHDSPYRTPQLTAHFLFADHRLRHLLLCCAAQCSPGTCSLYTASTVRGVQTSSSHSHTVRPPQSLQNAAAHCTFPLRRPQTQALTSVLCSTVLPRHLQPVLKPAAEAPATLCCVDETHTNTGQEVGHAGPQGLDAVWPESMRHAPWVPG